MTYIRPLLRIAFLLNWTLSVTVAQTGIHVIHPLKLEQVKINDLFWSPKLKVWDTKTVYDVFNKLEGLYEPDRKDLIDEKTKIGRTRNAFLNFDLVAQGKKNTGQHDGPPGMMDWYTKPFAEPPTYWPNILTLNWSRKLIPTSTELLPHRLPTRMGI